MKVANLVKHDIIKVLGVLFLGVACWWIADARPTEIYEMSIDSDPALTPGVSVFYEQYDGDTREYIEYIPGNLPIIISAPHGGVKLSGATVGGTFYPDNDNTLPDRNCGSNERDDNTDILAREIQSSIFDITGCYAHVIISNLHRSKLDPNREIGEASCGDADSEDHWHAFHDFVDDASTCVEAEWGKGVFIDLHGQSHSIPRIELGYNITSSQLNNADLNNQSVVDSSTIKNLVMTNLQGLSHEALVRGDHSLGELFQEAAGTFYAGLNYPGCTHNGTNGYRAVPSNTDTGNQSCDDTRPYGNAYFDGDYYNNRRHGSGPGASDGDGGYIGGSGAVDGIMTEVNRRVRDLGTYNGNVYDTRPQTLVPFADDYAQVLVDFVQLHYNDFVEFSYLECQLRIGALNVLPIIDGVSGGVFTSEPALSINSETGAIDLTGATAGDYEITYTDGQCGFYSLAQTITIRESIVGYVDQSGTGAGDGTSWSDAYQTLEDALAVACRYDTIKLAQGTYAPNTTDRSYSYSLYSDLTIEGGYQSGGVSQDPAMYPVILSGEIGMGPPTDNMYHTLFIPSTVTDLVLSNLTISDGYADGIAEDSKGAGLYNEGEITLDQVVVTGNSYLEPNSAVLNKGLIRNFAEVRMEGNVGL